MYSPNEANKNNDYITVKNNIFEGGYKGSTSVEPAMSSCRRRLADRWLAILSAIREQRPSTQRKKPM